MKRPIALAAVFLPTFAVSAAMTAQRPAAESCALTRPDFGVATAADKKLFAYDVNTPLNLQKAVENTRKDVEVSAISFDSPGGGRVTGLMFDPVTRASPRPGMVIVHGMGGKARGMAGGAQMFAERGAVVIAIDGPAARRGGSSPVQFTTQDRDDQIQLIKDLQRAVDVLRAHPNVDHGRMAYHGYSYGGAMGALFAGVERRIKAAALEVADGGLVSHYTGPGDQSGPLANLSCAARADWLRAMIPIEPIRFIGLASPTALLFQNGRADDAVPAADAEALHAAASQPKTIRWYDAGHGLNQQARFTLLDWLHEQIGLDARPSSSPSPINQRGAQ